MCTPWEKYITGTSLAVQWLRLGLPMQGAQVQSLVGPSRFRRKCRVFPIYINNGNTENLKQHGLYIIFALF